MKIEIKHRFTDAILFEADRENNTIKSTIEAALDAGADLSGANLSRANLSRADLSGASLSRANLSGASYGEGAPLTYPPIQLLGLKWPILFLDTHIKIGCELHLTTGWETFTPDQISAMAVGALDFWDEFKDIILAIAKKHQNPKEQ